jgi:hypothetical protein
MIGVRDHCVKGLGHCVLGLGIPIVTCVKVSTNYYFESEATFTF